MKPFFIFACLILFAGVAHALPQETLLVSDQNSELLVQCGMGVFDVFAPVPVYTAPVLHQEGQQPLSLPVSTDQNVAPVAAVPEPSTLGLLGMGLLLGSVLIGWRRRATRNR